MKGKKTDSRGQNDQAGTEKYWSLNLQELFEKLNATANGLSSSDAGQRLKQFGLNTIKTKLQVSAFRLLLGQFESPLVIILILAAIISGFLGEWVDAIIILVIVFCSTMLGFIQEYTASNAVEKLRSQLTIKSNVMRDGQTLAIPSEQVVPGDIVLLSAGSLIPADGVVLNANDFFVNEAVLTGETFPVEKKPGVLAADASLAERTNCVFMGTSVGSGSAQVVITETGLSTVFGEVAEHLRLRPPETEFERGIRQFGNMLTQVMLVMVVIVLTFNLLLKKPLIDSLLFSLALAVGLTPELLPAIISITLSFGAQQMAKRGVIVRRLNSIENFGSMDILCTDKTGTLTEGVVRLDGAVDTQGQPSDAILRLAYLNSYNQTGLANPMDDAIIGAAQKTGLVITDEQKVDEIPYDFVRKRLSIITVDAKGTRTMITKGALDNVLHICTNYQTAAGSKPLDTDSLAKIEQKFSDWSAQGFRVLGLAMKPVENKAEPYTVGDESGLTFAGFLLFFDPPKMDVQQVIEDLAKRGVEIKIITGDNNKVAQHITETVHLPIKGVLTGRELNSLGEEALWQKAEKTTIFAEVDPNQKERILLALKKTGHVVGYMGDGINDASALHAADVSVSVDSAVDVAKEAADFVLLKSDLSILRQGIDEGRKTFANTLKYIMMAVSSNFGNMFSMAGASLLLKFLPMQAPQILLENFLSDIPSMTIASDNVDEEILERPRRWNTKLIRSYMVQFGLVSSVFDFLTFGILLFIFHASVQEFQTGWFIESLLTEIVITLVIRTRHLFFKSRPGKLLLITSLIFIAITIAIPYLPFVSYLGFIPLPAPFMLTMIGLTVLYMITTEINKKIYYSRIKDA